MSNSPIGAAYLTLGAVVLASLIGIFTFLKPLGETIQSLRQDLAEQETHIAQREEFLRTLDQKIAALAREAQHEQQLNVSLPVGEATQDVVRLVHQAASASGGAVRRADNISAGLQSAVNARRARAEGTRLPDTVVPLGYDIDFTGSYQQLRVFLDSLAHAPRLLDGTRLEIQRNIQTPDSIAAHFTLQFYRYAEPKK